MKVKNDKTPVEDFLKVAEDAHDDFSKVLDAIQSHRPYYKELHKLYMKDFHLNWTTLVSKYYNDHFKDMGVSLNQNSYHKCQV